MKIYIYIYIFQYKNYINNFTLYIHFILDILTIKQTLFCAKFADLILARAGGTACPLRVLGAAPGFGGLSPGAEGPLGAPMGPMGPMGGMGAPCMWPWFGDVKFAPESSRFWFCVRTCTRGWGEGGGVAKVRLEVAEGR